MSFLLDTNILREAVKPKPHPGVHRRITRASADDLYTSAVCMAEIRDWTRGGENPGERWKRVEICLLRNVEVLPFALEDALHAGDLLFDLASSGQPISAVDSLIAAAALRHGFTLVTRNVRHFDRIPNLSLENWFE